MSVALMMRKKMMNVNKLTSTLRKLYHFIPLDSHVTIYKSFIRSHLDYADVIFDKPSNATFSNWIESAQYNPALAMTGTIRGTSKETTGYLYSLFSPPSRHCNTRKYSKIRQIFCRTETFSNSFLPQTMEQTWYVNLPSSFIFRILQRSFRLYPTNCK